MFLQFGKRLKSVFDSLDLKARFGQSEAVERT